jgi:hypothetical protein
MPLSQNDNRCFQGSVVLGLGFILNVDEATRILAADPRNAECLLPYLNGDDFNGQPDQTPTRYVIQFDERSEMDARAYPTLWRIVEDRVLPERRTKDARKYPRMVNEWWKHWNNRQELYRQARRLQRVLVRSRIGDQHAIAFVPTSWCYNEKTIVFAYEDGYSFALLQSGIHECWMRRYTSTLRTDTNYAPTDCFETFAFPQHSSTAARAEAERIGDQYYERRRQALLARRLGLTKMYNLVNDPEHTESDIAEMRAMHAVMDRAILDCYGWQDLDPGHGFHQNERGQTRYTMSSSVRREILRRLLALNLEIAEREGNRPRSSQEAASAVRVTP